MKIILGIFASAFIITLMSFKPFTDCKTVRTGAFQFYAKNLQQECLIERNDSIQTESLLSSGIIVHTRVKWINDCSYQLSFIDINIDLSDSSLAHFKDMVVTVDIQKVEKDYYIASSRSNRSPEILSDTLRRVTR